MVKVAVDDRLAQFNADNGHRLFALPESVDSEDEDADMSPTMGTVTGAAPPTIAAQKDSEEIVVGNDEGSSSFFTYACSLVILALPCRPDLARILFEDQELATLQTCLLHQAASSPVTSPSIGCDE